MSDAYWNQLKDQLNQPPEQPFDESDWLDMAARLDEKDRPKAAWWWLGLLAGGIGLLGVLWIFPGQAELQHFPVSGAAPQLNIADSAVPAIPATEDPIVNTTATLKSEQSTTPVRSQTSNSYSSKNTIVNSSNTKQNTPTTTPSSTNANLLPTPPNENIESSRTTVNSLAFIPGNIALMPSTVELELTEDIIIPKNKSIAKVCPQAGGPLLVGTYYGMSNGNNETKPNIIQEAGLGVTVPIFSRLAIQAKVGLAWQRQQSKEEDSALRAQEEVFANDLNTVFNPVTQQYEEFISFNGSRRIYAFELGLETYAPINQRWFIALGVGSQLMIRLKEEVTYNYNVYNMNPVTSPEQSLTASSVLERIVTSNDRSFNLFYLKTNLGIGYRFAKRWSARLDMQYRYALTEELKDNPRQSLGGQVGLYFHF